MALTVDDVITAITEADTTDEALAVLERVSRDVLELVADQLYVETFGKGLASVRLACLAEARG